MGRSNIIANYDFIMNEFRLGFATYIRNTPEKIRTVKQWMDMPHDGSIEAVTKTGIKRFLAYSIGIDPGNIDKYIEYTPKRGVRDLQAEDIEKVAKYLVPDVPLFLNADRFLKSLILSSDLLFRSRNEKVVLAVMLDRSKIGRWWTAKEIICECAHYTNISKYYEDRVEKCLDPHCKEEHPELPIYTAGSISEDYALYSRKITADGVKCYQLRLTELIAYYNHFLRSFSC